MSDRYAVIGNPVAHSRSPDIQAAFARQTAQDIQYLRVLAPVDGFAAAVAMLRAEGARGANVTVPFKEEAFQLATGLSDRARAAGAVNTLSFSPEGIFGDNTDGIGLVRDLTNNLDFGNSNKRVLLLGAGGAARGAIGPLLEQKPMLLVIANRTEARARDLVARFASTTPSKLEWASFLSLAGQGFDIVINATAASLAGEAPSLPMSVYAGCALAYDMMYAKGDTPFMAVARAQGVTVADGLGMLVEQAAESFFLWRGLRPATRPVLEALRRSLRRSSQ
ncbi:MAG: shikimate dehydrogenase [Betaproteobacteria bacterium]|nr:shikimate dehydrogenase [Betaproteobacteria bacterium]